MIVTERLSISWGRKYIENLKNTLIMLICLFYSYLLHAHHAHSENHYVQFT